jgi:hypothetical protein
LLTSTLTQNRQESIAESEKEIQIQLSSGGSWPQEMVRKRKARLGSHRKRTAQTLRIASQEIPKASSRLCRTWSRESKIIGNMIAQMEKEGAGVLGKITSSSDRQKSATKS